VKVPQSLPGWVQVKGAGHESETRFVSLLDILRQNIHTLFPDMIVLAMMRFRLTRNADIERDEEDADDLLEMIEEEIRQRRFEKVVRLEHGPNADPWMLEFLKQELDIDPEDVYAWPHDIDFRNLKPLTDLKVAGLNYEPWVPVVPQSLAYDQSIFSAIRSGDILVHHPFEDFVSSVERFIRSACDDPRVRAIKMTLYRTSDDSPFIRTLIRAAEMGKQVVCLVELKARFDEEKNIYWAQALEKAGVHVVYGIVGLKTHTKIALVVREENDGLRSYVHIGTGNYNVQTARLYTDLGYFTCRQDIVDDVIELFNYLTGRSLRMDYRRLLVAPVNMKDRFLQMIDREAEHAKAGRPSGIVAKQNSLEDRTVCSALYQASQAGVPIDLIVRGFCCLRAGVAGLSPTIQVRSVIGRFLEHSRIYFFRNGAADPLDGEFYIGSADWMYRNLQSRVEAITPIVDRPLRERLWEILSICLEDQRQAWVMDSTGVYTQLQPKDEVHRLGTQDVLMKLTRQRKELAHGTMPVVETLSVSVGDERKT
jgi:polyphosphate kinase